MISRYMLIAVPVQIFSQNLEMLADMENAIKQDFRSVIRHYEDENTDELRVHLVAEAKCSRCNLPFPQCQCGRPSPRPSV